MVYLELHQLHKKPPLDLWLVVIRLGFNLVPLIGDLYSHQRFSWLMLPQFLKMVRNLFEYLNLSKYPIWISLGGVPLELFMPEGLSCIASAVGTPLSLDKAIEQRRRINFARVCVEISSSDIILDHIMVDVETIGQIMVEVEYAWKPVLCSLCKTLGHSSTNYKAREEWRPKQPSTTKADANIAGTFASSSPGSVPHDAAPADGSLHTEPSVSALKVSDQTGAPHDAPSDGSLHTEPSMSDPKVADCASVPTKSADV